MNKNMKLKDFTAMSVKLAVLFLVFLFQSCSLTKFKGDFLANSLTPSTDSGNGGAYEGKPTPYHHFDMNNSCRDIGANGKPLPNKTIFLYKSIPGSSPQLVRENCSDLVAPINLPLASLQFANDGSGNFTFAGEAFNTPAVVSDFTVVAGACPTGYSAIVGATRKNLLQSSQDLLFSPWFYEPGVHGLQQGSLGGLPRYEIIRDDPAALQWYRRVHQGVPLLAGKTYAFSFFAQPGTKNEAYLSGWQAGNLALNVYFDLNTGAGRDVGTVGFSNLSYSSRPLSGGMIVTSYFTATVDAINYIGITPAAPAGVNGINDGPMGAVGDSIFSTALELEDVSNYCTKP